MRENERICNVLNELTVEEFLETYSENIQRRMSELGYYVKDGLICIDQEEIMKKLIKILLNILLYILTITVGFIVIIATLTFIIAWSAIGQEEIWQDVRNMTTHQYRKVKR